MNSKIDSLLIKMRALEAELEAAFHEHEDKVAYNIKGRRVRFEQQVKATHRQMKLRWGEYLKQTPPRHLLSAPFIYSMFFPLLILDISLFIYQQICFRAYRIPRVARADYVVIDRHMLAYLNLFEKFNCVYCGYGTGVLAYAREVSARTEQYWCPIKHARRAANPHDRYSEFMAYGEAEGFHTRLAEHRLRVQLGETGANISPGTGDTD
ncbi:MAG: hypothetical protein KBT88_03690 [Gammaproteobacteria bacterium]|nr:hypothetical protein [Gammaproteobacteria bacterium]MBQ0838864.1 hypothetical protein [Gammaproteobacteria bacterium]